jgi:GT2 family glycosyltransferase
MAITQKFVFKVSIVIPNWNGVHLMRKHLKNVIAASHGAEIIIADDASSDGSVEYLQNTFPHVQVVINANRVGFAGNVNSGVSKATGDIVVLLNTDVEPEKGFLQPLLKHFTDPDVFAVGCLEKSSENGEIVLRGRGVAHWSKGFYIHSRGEVNKDDNAWVSGGSSALRRSMWITLGGMDGLYNPFYWEDIDLSYRARKAGWKTLFEAESIVHHYHEKGVIRSEYTPADVKRIAYRNQYIFIWKNVHDFQIILVHLLWAPIRLIQSLMTGDFLHIQGYLLAVTHIGGIIVSRYRQAKLWKRTDSELDME